MSEGLQMKYFVLKPRGSDHYAFASRAAMYAYADAIEEENPALAVELRTWANATQAQADLGGKLDGEEGRWLR